jgi:hypothetical protein
MELAGRKGDLKRGALAGCASQSLSEQRKQPGRPPELLPLCIKRDLTAQPLGHYLNHC